MGEDCVDLGNTMLYVQAKITKQDGTNLDANDPVGPVNLLLHSLFSQVDISLNGTQVTSYHIISGICCAPISKRT